MTLAEFTAFYPQFAGFTPAVVMTTYIAQANDRFASFPEADAEETRRLYAALDMTTGFYGVFVPDTLTKEQALALAEHVEGLGKPAVLFAPAGGTPAEAVASGGLLKTLYDRGLKRTVPFYCANQSDTAALLGTAMGLDLSHPSFAFALCYKTLSGVAPSDLAQSQADAVKALNGNVYVARSGSHLLLESGTCCSRHGRRSARI